MAGGQLRCIDCGRWFESGKPVAPDHDPDGTCADCADMLLVDLEDWPDTDESVGQKATRLMGLPVDTDGE